jgi:hypothetical protein
LIIKKNRVLAFWDWLAGGGSGRVNQPLIFATNQGRVSQWPAFVFSANSELLAIINNNPKY